MLRLTAVLLVVIAGLAAGAYLVLRSDEPPSYSPLDLENDPWAYDPDRQADFEARAAAGHSHVVYAKSPGGILATARRVEHWRPQVEKAAEASGVDPDLIEAMVLLESAGRPDARASDDLEGAVGLTQILAETASNLLGMHVDVKRSERLIRRLGRAKSPAQAARIRAELMRVDERFDPGKALAGTGRYLKTAMDEFGREDLAVVSYHMGIGNLQQVLGAYGDDDASYAQLYFDASPEQNPRAYRRLLRLGDDSKTYYWRVLASRQVMRLYRRNRGELERRAALHEGADSGELVLQPPALTDQVESREDMDAALRDGALRPFPNRPARYGLRPARPGGGLRPEAFALAAYIGRGVRHVSGVRTPLTVTSTVRQDGGIHATGYAFDVRRSYANGRQAEAFQYMLDRLQALNLIAWTRDTDTIHITASREGRRLMAVARD
jgi:soluble lytic murein transglycosylase-like protein